MRLRSTIMVLALLLSTKAADAGVIFYSSQAAFNAATTGLSTQTFAAATPGGGVGINNPLDSTTNDGVFATGDILAGLTITATTSNGGDIAVLPVNFAGTGLTNQSVFSNYFAGMNFAFSPSVTAASLNVLSLFSSADVTLSIFSPSSVLLGTFTVLGAPNTGVGTFIGVIANGGDTIGSITITASGGNSPGVDQVQFGAVAVPEPATMTLLGLGAIGFGAFARRRKATAC